MNTTPLPAATSVLSEILPAAEVARVVRLAIDTLVSILSDAKAAVAERRRAAMTILTLSKPAAKRAPSASSGCTPAIEPASPTPTPMPARTPAFYAQPATPHPSALPQRDPNTRTHRLVTTAGAAPIPSQAPRSRLTG